MINNRLGTLLLGGIFVVGAVTFNTLTNNSRPADIKDALNDDDIWTRPSNSEERMIMPEPKPTADYAGGNKQKESGALNLSKGIDADGQEYRHVPNSGNYQGVYMTQSKNATGFLDIFGAGKGFCQGDKLSVSIRAVNKQGKPVVMGTCIAPTATSVLRENFKDCDFSVHLMKDAASGKPLAYFTINRGACASYGDGKADLASIAGVGFWLLK